MARKAPAPSSAQRGILASLVAMAAFVAVALGAWRDRDRPPAAPEPDDPPKPPPALLAAVDRWQRRHPAVAFLLGVTRKFADDGAANLAALVSYFAFFSVFPLLLALTSVLGMVLEDNPDLQERITGTATDQIPIIGPTLGVGELTGSTPAVVIGIAVALWSGLKVIDAAQNALNDVWDVPRLDRPTLIKRRSKSLLLLGLIGVSLLGSVVISVAAGLIPDLPRQGILAIYGLTVLLNCGVFLLAFKLLSEVEHSWGELVPGSVFAAVGWFVVQVPGAFYIQRVVNNASATYQSFATVIGLLTYFFLLSQVVIIGAEINVVRARRLWPRSLLARHGVLTPADEQAHAAAAAATRRVATERIVVGFGPGRRVR